MFLLSSSAYLLCSYLVFIIQASIFKVAVGDDKIQSSGP